MIDGQFRRVTVGGSFRATWVSSGAAASPIVYNVRTGSETLANSYAGVDSGNGLYYANAVIGTPGLWKGEWYATVSANTYRNTEWLLVSPGDADQPGRYITWDDVVNRFYGFTDVADAVLAASHYLSYAEAYLDSRLGATFTVPFSSNNQTIRDLTIDVVYARSIRGSRSEEYKAIWAEVSSRLAALINGDDVMISASGALIGGGPLSTSPAWSSTQGYHPVHAVALDYADMVPSSVQLIDELDERGLPHG